MAAIEEHEVMEPRPAFEADALMDQTGHKVEILELIDPYLPDRSCRYRPLPGNKYVMLRVAVTNTDIMPLVASFSDFSLETDRGRRHRPIIMPEMEEDFGAARCPAPGQSDAGMLLFEIQLIAAPVALWEEISGQERPVVIPGNGDAAVVA